MGLPTRRDIEEIEIGGGGDNGDLKKIEDALERDYFLTAEMAVDFGIVDKVIDQRPTQPATAAA